ncbi:MAG: GntR family transcriptional regulator [Ruminococcaceae bacterium]|nr:GntR family transcriptional regulator [Oscillospiraceae bacterium]
MSTGSLSDKVFEKLESDILTGTLATGEVLSENKLSAALGVSRTPVREALQRLVQDGLVRQEAGHGLVVHGVTVDDLIDIYDIRLRIEGMAARDAAVCATAEQLAELSSLVELQEFYAARGDADKLRDTDSQFHSMLYNCCSRRILSDTLQGLHHRVERYRRMSVQSPERALRMAEEHRAILDAFTAHDADAAERLVTEHISNALASLRSSVAKD